MAGGRPPVSGWLGASLARAFQSMPSTDAALRSGATHFPIPLTTGRPRLVVLGTGWGGARLLQDIDPAKYDITLISPRNHFVFTPLVTSCCVGTLEPRAVTLGVTDLQRALKAPQNFYYAADAVAVHPRDRIVEARSPDGLPFAVEYDVLAIATGSQGSTFGIPGVGEHAHFLRDAANAQAIRDALIRSWGLANTPGRAVAERDRLLHTVIVGGGPTGVEFAGDLADFINRDLHRLDPSRAADMRVTLVEANQLLGSFDARLREYAAGKLSRAGVHLVKAVVKEVRAEEVELVDGQVLPFGLLVWSTGVGPTPFVLSLPFVKTPKGRLAVDPGLRVMLPRRVADGGDGEAAGGGAMQPGPGPKAMTDVSITADEEPEIGASSGGGGGSTDEEPVPVLDVYALGDCCANADAPLPALAQVAEQQGKFLAGVLNAKAGAVEGGPAAAGQPKFVYRSLGAMATVGGRAAVIELARPAGRRLSWAGFASFLAWRSAYLTRLGTLKARLYVAGNWTMTLLFGRDVNRW